ncbi:MAG: hypothetical protein Q9170_001653 [Blastenia crenularia]
MGSSAKKRKDKKKDFQQPVSVLFPKILPLTLDGSHGVRTQLLRLLRSLPSSDVEDHVGQVLLYIRAGTTHLAADIRSTTLDMLLWALECSGNALVSCAGGWVKTLKSLMAAQGWSTEPDSTGWSSAMSSTGTPGSKDKLTVKSLSVMASFLRVGFQDEEEEEAEPTGWGWPLVDTAHHLRIGSFSHLNLFGPIPDEESQMYEDREDRQRIFHKTFRRPLEHGLETAKRAGGEVGRTAAAVQKVINDGMKDFEGDE